MTKDFKATAGDFALKGQYGGHPHWHSLTYNGKEVLRLLQPDDLKDLQYLINRALEHYEIHGSKT